MSGFIAMIMQKWVVFYGLILLISSVLPQQEDEKCTEELWEGLRRQLPTAENRQEERGGTWTAQSAWELLEGVRQANGENKRPASGETPTDSECS